MIQFRVNEELCTKCGECAADCPAGIICIENYPRITNEEYCIRCQHCLAVCPTGAVSVWGKDPEASTKISGNIID
ncbi:MAG: 4Fe-4S binding protein, partial [Nitrospirae bacterium]|nr:4Fe-4S binding protein [Nitrospirota bacterium]